MNYNSWLLYLENVEIIQIVLYFYFTNFCQARVSFLSGIYDIIIFGKYSKSRALPVLIFGLNLSKI